MRNKTKEKIETQVLNLDEVRAYSKQEKVNNRHKLSIKFVFVALLLIALGVVYLPGKSFVEKLQAEEKITPTNKNSITCTVDKAVDSNGYEFSETIIYNFKEDDLIGYNKVSTTKLIKNEDQDKFKAYYEELSKKYKNLTKEEGFNGDISLVNNEIIQKITVDLEKMTKKNEFVNYSLNTPKSEIIKKEKANKKKCD